MHKLRASVCQLKLDKPGSACWTASSRTRRSPRSIDSYHQPEVPRKTGEAGNWISNFPPFTGNLVARRLTSRDVIRYQQKHTEEGLDAFNFCFVCLFTTDLPFFVVAVFHSFWDQPSSKRSVPALSRVWHSGPRTSVWFCGQMESLFVCRSWRTSECSSGQTIIGYSSRFQLLLGLPFQLPSLFFLWQSPKSNKAASASLSRVG